MANKNEKNATFVAEIIAYLVRLGYVDRYSRGLTSAQWIALRYFSKANLISRTLSAFADYHVTTRGTASQTVHGLVKKGFLERTPSPFDGRSSQIDLTTKGHAMSKKDPYQELEHAIADLPEKQQAEIASALERVMRWIAEDRRRPLIGTCQGCRNLEESAGDAGSEKTYVCLLVGQALPHPELRKLCINYQPNSSYD